MQSRFRSRRAAWQGLTASLFAPPWALAARPRLTLATGALPPLVSAAGQQGFLDALAEALFDRVGFDVSLVILPFERALINANAGIEDGEMFRAAGFEREFPNLVIVPEKVLDLAFAAYTLRSDVEVRDWSGLAGYRVGFVKGWKLFEREVKAAREITTVRAVEHLLPLLANGRVDVVLMTRLQGLRLGAAMPLRELQPPLAREPMFIYMNRRHASLVAPLTAALIELKRDGSWQRLHDRTLKPLTAPR